MRFEVEVDDGNGLNTLHRARASWNEAHKDRQAEDLPSLVQMMMDDSVAAAVAPFGPTLDAAQAIIADLKAENATLKSAEKVAA